MQEDTNDFEIKVNMQAIGYQSDHDDLYEGGTSKKEELRRPTY